jgi:hypothetical protein
MYVERATSNAEPQGVAQVLLALKRSLQKNNHRVLVQILDLLRGQPLALPELQGTANFFLLYVAKELSDPLLRGRTALRRCVVSFDHGSPEPGRYRPAAIDPRHVRGTTSHCLPRLSTNLGQRYFALAHALASIHRRARPLAHTRAPSAPDRLDAQQCEDTAIAVSQRHARTLKSASGSTDGVPHGPRASSPSRLFAAAQARGTASAEDTSGERSVAMRLQRETWLPMSRVGTWS